jgi:transcriptional regulator with XRE-family HTH domain
VEVVRLSIDEILKRIRIELEISQETLASELNVSFATINRWENKRVSPSRLAMMRLKEYCVKKSLSREIIEQLEKYR